MPSTVKVRGKNKPPAARVAKPGKGGEGFGIERDGVARVLSPFFEKYIA
jgi:hypothetical protein